jgi:predicted site-specific integrase-resolvase
VWRIRSRVYKWYGQLRLVEQKVEDAPAATRMQVYEEQLKRLTEIEELVNQVSIPLSFADGLYGLRSHIQFVRKRILFLMEEAAAPAVASVPV